MGWTLIAAKEITHDNGHKISLADGSWKEPYDINIKMKPGLSAFEQARLVREGLEFAAAQSYSNRSSERRPPVVDKTPKKKHVPTRPLLSLKKRQTPAVPVDE
ncbi:MAG: hypothetical protein ACI93R_004052 [Flavobacteriales bacterium]|jgi:hypothetical protein